MRVLEYFLGFLLMNCLSCLNEYVKQLIEKCNFWCGIMVLGGFTHVLEVFTMFLLLGFGLKFLKFNFYIKGFNRFISSFSRQHGLFENGFCPKKDLVVDGLKISSANCGNMKNLSPSVFGKLEKTDSLDYNSDALAGDSDDDNQDSGEKCDEDNVFDVMLLRKLVKMERRRASSACLELEKERMASATATEEAMAMILRLQNEKSLIDMEARQYKRLAEEKQLYDQEVIQSLQWLVLKHESERILLVDQLRMCQQKWRMQSNDDDELEKFENSACSFDTIENALNTRLLSSLDMDLAMQ